jgi:hypothetical protein
MAWLLRQGEHDAIPEAIAESAGTREGQRDFCIGVLGNYFERTILEDSSGAAVFKSHRRVLNRYENSLSLKSIGKSIRQVKANPSNQQL